MIKDNREKKGKSETCISTSVSVNVREVIRHYNVVSI